MRSKLILIVSQMKLQGVSYSKFSKFLYNVFNYVHVNESPTPGIACLPWNGSE